MFLILANFIISEVVHLVTAVIKKVSTKSRVDKSHKIPLPRSVYRVELITSANFIINLKVSAYSSIFMGAIVACIFKNIYFCSMVSLFKVLY